jgi:hypothetical protein
VVVEEDERDEAVPEGCSTEHKQQWRGDAMTAKSGGGLSLAQMQRRVRESSRARGIGVGSSAGWRSHLWWSDERRGGGNGRYPAALTPLMAGGGYEGGGWG